MVKEGGIGAAVWELEDSRQKGKIHRGFEARMCWGCGLGSREAGEAGIERATWEVEVKVSKARSCETS